MLRLAHFGLALGVGLSLVGCSKGAVYGQEAASGASGSSAESGTSGSDTGGGEDSETSEMPAETMGGACEDEEVECGEDCVDLQEDALNCGACGEICVVGESCIAGVCTSSCSEPASYCEGACVDITASQTHCGACNSPCSTGEQCSEGACALLPPDGCENEDCNGHGWCVGEDTCVCDIGYSGGGCGGCDGVWKSYGFGQCRPEDLLDGTNETDILDGTDADDSIRGRDGDDLIRGLGGNDWLDGDDGIDTLSGDLGRDELRGSNEDDMLFGGADDDALFGNDGDDTIVGGPGSDRMTGGEGNDTLMGDLGDDSYMIDGLGDDVFDDIGGFDRARCVPGVTVVDETFVDGDRVLILDAGGTVTVIDDAVELFYGCS